MGGVTRLRFRSTVNTERREPRTGNMFEIKVEKWERFRRQRNRLIVVLLISASMTGCGSDRLPNAPDDLVTPVRVLMITTTAGFRHDSIPAAIASIRSLSDVTLTATEDLSALADSRLVNYDVVMFALTSGELALSAAQKSALVELTKEGDQEVVVIDRTAPAGNPRGPFC